MTTTGYIPPLRYHALTRFYDAAVRITTRENTWKHALVEQIAARAHQRVLDLGCGTGTLTIALARRYPDSKVTGLDADTEALALALGKMKRAGIYVELKLGRAEALPFADASFDRVASSLFFHHLNSTQKTTVLGEARRVLKDGGELHVADWGHPANAVMRAAFFTVQLLDGFETTADNVEGRLPQLFGQSGFVDVHETASLDTPLGTVRLYRASKSSRRRAREVDAGGRPAQTARRWHNQEESAS